MDVADSDFLSNKEFDDEDSEFETDLERYFVFSTAKNRFFGRKIPLRVTLGSGLSMLLWLFLHHFFIHDIICKFHSCCKNHIESVNIV